MRGNEITPHYRGARGSCSREDYETTTRPKELADSHVAHQNDNESGIPADMNIVACVPRSTVVVIHEILSKHTMCMFMGFIKYAPKRVKTIIQINNYMRIRQS